MFKDGEWVKWDGSDVSELIIRETMTKKEFEQNYPELIYEPDFYYEKIGKDVFGWKPGEVIGYKSKNPELKESK